MESADLTGIRVILLDIEGTTTPIAFVHKALFTYAAENIEGFLERNYERPEIWESIRDLHVLYEDDSEDRMPSEWILTQSESDIAATSEYFRWLISKDSKAGAMKALQGHVWEEGFRSGNLRGEVYPDVPAAMERWINQGKRICIYSSGSTLAQRLIYSSTEFGDLTEYISNFYDTSVGHKRDEKSYSNIAKSENVLAGSILFLSDVSEELDAAERAGMKTILVDRDSNVEMKNYTHTTIKDFEELFT